MAAIVGITPWLYDKVTDEPCPGAGCEGRTPKTGGCAVNPGGHEPADRRANPARLQVRYSERCDAVWGRILQGEAGDVVTVQVRGGKAHWAKINYGTDQFTKMASVGDRFVVKVCATPDPVTKNKDKWKRYCIQATEKTAWKQG